MALFSPVWLVPAGNISRLLVLQRENRSLRRMFAKGSGPAEEFPDRTAGFPTKLRSYGSGNQLP